MLFRFVLCLFLAVVLAGVNTAGAAEKPTYETPGCPVFTLGDGFQYMGEPGMNISTYCSGNNCNTLLAKPGTKARYDLFAVASPDKAPEEVCLFIRYELVGRRHHWAATKGNNVTINGRYYSELFAVYLGEKKQDFKAVEEYLAEQGHPVAEPGYVAYLVQRNINVETRLTVIYACNVRMLPKEILKDGKKIEQFLRDRFAERVVPL
jgi:hypothetical protein